MENEFEPVRTKFRSAYKAYVEAGAALHRALCADAREYVADLQSELTTAADTYEHARSEYVSAVMAQIDAPVPGPEVYAIARLGRARGNSKHR